ncbi:hypothetical protein C488_00065 [Natrinema pellirubrum DSM 15624]|uniref:Uncharacterized protein n=1 Tax=Natrinema pellirubrum (strain DSM 15624 / CIP 106293 / JCM 10476 / NCIMB 786 / 157) TaxID=797303 RepID=L0JLM5_NATP1|nr:hypothetical protein [Natrinema pellirubrum]AGB31477.1 hypothetical protein Natpe_1578 [Natrinema pellirubrum DSM 15624]ELY82222.1 hypothetical protein C488_00065 [Natrinema pellirubrum DSM 15624]
MPAENQAVEIDHNRQVHGEMQELRNAIKNAGTTGGTTSISVTLGTQYPTRTFLTNPPDPTGTLRTSETGAVGIDNAEFNGRYTTTADEFLEEDFETRTLSYEPSYNEYRDAPTTRIEHGFAFNEFTGTSVALTEQPLVDGNRLTIVLVEGNLSTSSRGSTAVDTRILSGPTDPISLEDDGDNITITVPTSSPNAWNESIGTEFGAGSGAEHARVTGYADGQLRVELEGDMEYELRMARVGVGDGRDDGPDEFDISRVTAEDTNSSGAYDVRWDTDRINDEEHASCTDESCTFTAATAGDTIQASVETAPAVDDADVEYAVGNNEIAGLVPGRGTIQDGVHETALEARSNGTTTLFASSGGAGDALDVTVAVESAEASLPEGSVAYHDRNDDGVYNDGEPTYTESDLESVDVPGSLIVVGDAFSANGMDLTAEQLTVEEDATLETRNGGIRMTTNSGELAVAGTLDTTAGTGQSVTLDATGETDLSSGTVRSSGGIDVDASGSITADDATLDATDASYGSITVSGDGSVALRRAIVQTEGTVSITAGATLDATAADLESTRIGQGVALESNGDMTIERISIDVDRFSTMSGELNGGSNTLFVDGAEFRRGDDPGAFDFSPNGVDVRGTPAVGWTW